jgi:deoxyribodipyrimidine photo-lyase
MHIPLHTITHTPRRTLPERVMNFLQSVNAKHIFGNLEYPVDELRRDLRVCLLAKEQGVKPVFVHDKLIIEPGKLSTLQGKPYTVRSSTLLSIGLL